MSEKPSKILELKKLLDTGAISEEEFAHLQTELVNNQQKSNWKISTEESKILQHLAPQESNNKKAHKQSPQDITRLTYLIVGISLAWLIAILVL